MYLNLLEATLSQIKRKQRSITRLFPDFFTNPIKVKGVIDKGGLRMVSMDGDTWNFKVHSGSEEGLWYKVVIRWKNLVPELQRAVADRRNWNRAKTKVDLKKVAAQLFKKGDVELECSCPADLYWGKHYIRSKDKYQAKYGEPENRSPDIRNPKQYGAYCKHIEALMKALPWYKSTLASQLRKSYAKVIAQAEKKAAKEYGKFKAAAGALKKRKRESIDEARHSHEKCMDCSSAPEVEVIWAEGMGHAWFCMKHFKKWATTGYGKGDVCAVKNVQDGKAAMKWADNTSPNIMDSMKFLKEASLKKRESIEEITARQLKDELGVINAEGKVKTFGVDTEETHGLVKARNPGFKQAMDYWVVDTDSKFYLVLRIYIPMTSDQVIAVNKILKRYPDIKDIAVALKPTLTGQDSTVDLDVPVTRDWAARIRQEY